jgi:hypothetical protein
MPKQICEISASSWFYYKEISYDARSRERKKMFKPHYVYNVRYFFQHLCAFGGFVSTYNSDINCTHTDSVSVAVIVVETVGREGFEIFRYVEQLCILPFVINGCETLFENRELRRIFGPKREEVPGEWRFLRNE